MDRRRFARLCASTIAAAPLMARAAAAAGTGAMDEGPASGSRGRPDGGPSAAGPPRSRLRFEDGRPVTPAALADDEAWIFGYPYVVTPAFLVRLGPDAMPGADASARTVAFSAICTHRMTHPSRPITHIGYRTAPTAYLDASGERAERTGLVSCCSGRSLFDPGAGGAVLAGPAPAPLVRIRLETSEDGIHAVGTSDPALHERFVDAFGFRLGLEHALGDVRERPGASVAIESAARFSRQRVEC